MLLLNDEVGKCHLLRSKHDGGMAVVQKALTSTSEKIAGKAFVPIHKPMQLSI
jgi:hypothetical protein